MMKTKKIFSVYFFSAVVLFTNILFCLDAFGQAASISNNASAPNPSAMLDITSGTSNNLGILIPRVTYVQRTGNFSPLPAAAQGLLVYQTDALGLGEGLYYNTSTTTTPNWVKAGSSGWDVSGNSGTSAGTNFIGTTDANGIDFSTNNSVRMSITSGGNVGIGSTSPGTLFSVGGNGGNVYATTSWIENNIHVQGNEGLTTVGGRGRLRVGTAWGYVGLYADANSAGAGNDLVLGSSSGIVRIGPGSAGQRLLIPANSSFQMIDNAAQDKILRTDASGNGTWQPLSTLMSASFATASQTLINSSSWININGLSVTITLTGNSYVIIRTAGNLEFQGGAGTWCGTIVSLANNGTSLQEQGTDFTNDGYVPIAQVDHIWQINHALTLGAGTYTFTVRARAYWGGPFYAGWSTPTGNSGSLMVRVIPQ